jgi:magnesium-transporting ATPase (P-type)
MAGVRVKMITGDHVATARAIARQIGLDEGSEPVAVSGRELERLSSDKFAECAEQATVFARVAPEQKLQLVQALQLRGQVVAMTGDGVNDAPALKQADIGVAMGRSGTEVAKGAADMVLTDDNFATIEAAVEEGRCVFDNLTKFIVWTLPTNVGEALVVLAAICLGVNLPTLPVQLLWINMATAVLLGMTLAFEPKERPDGASTARSASAFAHLSAVHADWARLAADTWRDIRAFCLGELARRLAGGSPNCGSQCNCVCSAVLSL